MLSTDVGAAPAASTLQEGAPFGGASRRESGTSQDDFAAMFDRCAGEATPDATVKAPGRGRSRAGDPLSGVPVPQATQTLGDTPVADESAPAGLVSGVMVGTSVDEPDADADPAEDATAAFDPRFFVPVPVALTQPVQDPAVAAQSGSAADLAASSNSKGFEQASLAGRMPMHARGPLAAFQGLTPRPTAPVPSQSVAVAAPPAIDDPIAPVPPDESSVEAEVVTIPVDMPALTLTADEQRAVADAVAQLQAADTPSPARPRGQDMQATASQPVPTTPDARTTAMAAIATALAGETSGSVTTGETQATTTQVAPDATRQVAVPEQAPAAAETLADASELPSGLEKAMTTAPPQAAPGLQRAATHAAKPTGTSVAIQAEAPPATASGTSVTDQMSSGTAEPAPMEPTAEAVAPAEPAPGTDDTRRPNPAGKPAFAVAGQAAVAADGTVAVSATHVKARTGQQDVAAPSAAPRPSARVAHAIAAFQAAANAAATTPLTGAQPALASGAVPTTLLDQELPTQIVQAIRVQFDNGSGAAHVRLNPGFLGGMRVGVEVDGTSVVASLQATSADVREWMQRNEPALRQALADQGLHLERLVIVDDDSRPTSDDERGTREQSQQQQREPSKRSRRPETEGTFELEL